MSGGLFKNFDKIIAVSSFAKNTHKYIVTFGNSFTNPAAYYFNPIYRTQKLPKGHSYDNYQLSCMLAQLSRQNYNYGWILDEIAGQQDQSKFSEIKNILEEEIKLNDFARNQFLSELILAFKADNQNISLQACSDTIYALESKELQVYNIFKGKIIYLRDQHKRYVVPVLKQKLKYSSSQNLIDIVVGLNSSKFYEDKQLWSELFNEVKNKTFSWELNEVNYHGWTTDLYETADKEKDDDFSTSSLETYFDDLKGGNGLLAKGKYSLTKCFRWAQFNFLFPFQFRQSQIKYQFDNRDVQEDKKLLANAFKELGQQFEEGAKVYQIILSKV